MRKVWIFLGILLSVGLVGGAGYLGLQSGKPEPQATPQAPNTIPVTTCDVAQTVTAPGKLVNYREVTLEIPVTGPLSEILVRPGDAVEAGEVVARLGNSAELAAMVTTTQLEVLQAEQALASLYDNNPLAAAQALVDMVNAQAALEEAQKNRQRLDWPRASGAMIDQAQAYYELVESAYQRAQEDYDSVAHLPPDDPERLMALSELSAAKTTRDQALATLNWYLGTPSEEEITSAEAQIVLAEAQLEAAQGEWERLKDGPDPLEVELAEARIADAKARLATAEEALASVEIQAPFSGIVLEVNAQAGATVNAHSPLMVLNDPTAVEVEATVIEEDMPYVEVGHPVELFFDALPDAEMSGRITRILPRRAPGDRPLYYIYISLEDVPEKLVAGMTADASVVIAQRKGVLCLPRALVSASAQGSAVVEVWTGVRIEKRTIEVGLRGDVNVEIISGLVEGEQVVSR